LTCRLIDAARDLPRSSLVRKRFGNMRAAYQEAGYYPAPIQNHIEIRRSLAGKFAAFVNQILDELKALGLSVLPCKWQRSFLIGGEFIFSFKVIRCTPDKNWNTPQWILANGKTSRSDYVVAIRTDLPDHEPLDYYFLPSIELPPKRVWLGSKKMWKRLERYRFDSRADLVGAVHQSVIEPDGHCAAVDFPED
jgi:hypothetical protein